MIKRLTVIFVMALLWSVAQAGYSQRVPAIQPPQLDNAAGPSEIRQAQTPNPKLTQRQAIELAQKRFTGNILRISLIGEGSALQYQIRMENEGKIFTVFVNATTGAVTGG